MKNKILLTLLILITLVIAYFISVPRLNEYNKYMCATQGLDATCSHPLPISQRLK